MTEQHKEMLNAYWVVFKKYAGMKQEDTGWSELVSEITNVFENYRDTEYSKLATGMFFAFLGEIERLSKC